MGIFQTTTEVVLPELTKRLKLTAGQKIADDPEVIEFAQRTVPAGKKVSVTVIFRVRKLEDE